MRVLHEGDLRSFCVLVNTMVSYALEFSRVSPKPRFELSYLAAEQVSGNNNWFSEIVIILGAHCARDRFPNTA